MALYKYNSDHIMTTPTRTRGIHTIGFRCDYVRCFNIMCAYLVMILSTSTHSLSYGDFIANVSRACFRFCTKAQNRIDLYYNK